MVATVKCYDNFSLEDLRIFSKSLPNSGCLLELSQTDVDPRIRIPMCASKLSRDVRSTILKSFAKAGGTFLLCDPWPKVEIGVVLHGLYALCKQQGSWNSKGKEILFDILHKSYNGLPQWEYGYVYEGEKLRDADTLERICRKTF